MEHEQRKSKKKLLWFIISAVALIIIIATIVIVWYAENRRGWEQVERRTDHLENIIHMEVSSTGDGIIMIAPTDSWLRTSIYLPLDKIVLSEREGWEKNLGGTPWRLLRRWNRVDTHIYNLVTGERLETINVLQGLRLVAGDMIGYQLKSGGAFPVEHENGQGDLYLSWYLENIPTSPYTPREVKFLLLNLHTREWSIDRRTRPEYESISEDLRQRELERQLMIFRPWDAKPEEGRWFLSINGIEVTRGYPPFVRTRRILGQVEIRMEAFQLPKENEELYHRFHGLREFVGREDLEVAIILNDFPTAQEILALIIEDGHEITFDGSILRSDWSIDGLEHEINSFDDFFNLLTPDW